jgi:DNA modification methylase
LTKTNHKIIFGDSRRMSRVPEESVHLVVTSPPYWQLKDYGGARQIGFHDSYEDYINNLNLVWNECARALHRGCRLCVNIGDQFARSAYYGRYKVIPIRTEIIKFCESASLDYMGAIIWQKVTTTHTTGGATVMGSFPYPRNGILKLDYEFILIFKKPGKAPRVSKQIKDSSRLSAEEWEHYFSGHWNFPGEKQEKHLAMFPEELPRRLIRMFTFTGDTVLDPFLGSGTTVLAAKKLGRNSIGYETNRHFLPLIREKLGISQPQETEDASYEIIKQTGSGIDLEKAKAALPYLFSDPVGIGKRADARGKNYGSKIDISSRPREKYFSVKKVASPVELFLHDGTKIRLLGLREIPGKKKAAVRFLQEKTRGKKVYLKFDTTRFDDKGNLLCYLYLSNRTFLNSQLLKKGFAGADLSTDYRHKSRFEKLNGKTGK